MTSAEQYRRSTKSKTDSKHRFLVTENSRRPSALHLRSSFREQSSAITINATIPKVRTPFAHVRDIHVLWKRRILHRGSPLFTRVFIRTFLQLWTQPCILFQEIVCRVRALLSVPLSHAQGGFQWKRAHPELEIVDILHIIGCGLRFRKETLAKDGGWES